MRPPHDEWKYASTGSMPSARTSPAVASAAARAAAPGLREKTCASTPAPMSQARPAACASIFRVSA